MIFSFRFFFSICLFQAYCSFYVYKKCLLKNCYVQKIPESNIVRKKIQYRPKLSRVRHQTDEQAVVALCIEAKNEFNAHNKRSPTLRIQWQSTRAPHYSYTRECNRLKYLASIWYMRLIQKIWAEPLVIAYNLVKNWPNWYTVGVYIGLAKRSR